jgi:hypothetical protein
MNMLKNVADHFVEASHLREQAGDSFVGAGHARDCFLFAGMARSYIIEAI